MTIHSPTRPLIPTPMRVATVTLCLMLGGCTIVGDWFGGDKDDYKQHAHRTQPLDVPPDLTQLQKDPRYLPQGGVVTASDLSKAGTGAPAAPAAPASAATYTGAPQVALNAVGDVHIERGDGQRWLVTKEAPEVVLPKVREYWLTHGFALKVDDPKTGILETDWVENKAALPKDAIHNLIGHVLDNLYDSGLRDRYRTRLERAADGGTEVYVTHFGATEEATGFQKSEMEWVPRPNDPGLEAQQLSQLMLALGGQSDVNLASAKPETDTAAASGDAASTHPMPSATVQPLAAGGTGPNGAPRAHEVPGQAGATLSIDDNFDRAWRRIGLALDHGGFTVEDRDRAQGIYYVRFVDAKAAAKDEPGILSKLSEWFGRSGPSPVGKYRILVKASGDASTATVLNDQGQPSNDQNAKAIVARLVEDLK